MKVLVTGGKGLIVFVASLYAYAATHVEWNYYYVDVTSRALTPLMNDADLESTKDLSRIGEDGHSLVYHVPRTGVISPAGDVFFTANHEAGALEPVGISAIPLPFDGREPTHLGEVDLRALTKNPQYLVRASANGKALLFSRYVITFREDQ